MKKSINQLRSIYSAEAISCVVSSKFLEMIKTVKRACRQKN